MLRCFCPRPEWGSHKTAQGNALGFRGNALGFRGNALGFRGYALGFRGNALGDYVNKREYRPERAKQAVRTTSPGISASDFNIARNSPNAPPLQGLDMV